MRSIRKIHKAVNAPIADLVTFRALPARELSQIDPFLFLNHHGPQEYPPKNNGLPFGPHPHRGFETLTFIISGDIMHKDSGGGSSIIKEGGIQWMTAGSGLIHSEVSSDEFKRKGGRVEILQLWINLPARLKMTPPQYTGLQKEQIPFVEFDNGKVKLNAISGKWHDTEGAMRSMSDVHMASLNFTRGGKINFTIEAKRNIFFYVVKGSLMVNSQVLEFRNLAELNNEGEKLNIEALEDSIILLGHATPFNEPVVAQGPFVMNSQEEIRQAFRDYQTGKMGEWQED